MQVHIEDVGPCKKLLSFEIPPEKVREELDKSYLELSQKVDVPGFRKGHVPRKLMEKRFGEVVNKDVQGDIVSNSVEDALKENKLEMIGTPELPEAEGEIDLDKPFCFDVTLEVRPQIEIPDYASFVLTRQSTEVTEDDVELGIERLRRRDANFVPVDDAVARDDDMIVSDVTVSVDGNGIDHVEDVPVRPPLRSVVGIPCEQLPDVLRGARTGDTRTVTVTLPENHRNEEYAGKEAEIAIEVKDIKRLELPEVTEEWAVKMRFESLEHLRDTVRATFQREKVSQEQWNIEKQLQDRLLDAAVFDAPKGPIEKLTERHLRRAKLQLQMRNMDESEIEEHLAEGYKTAEAEAERECRLFFLFEAIADARHIYVTEDDIRRRVSQIAANYGRGFEAMRAEMDRDGSIEDLRIMMRREKTLQYLLGKVKITDAGTQEINESENQGEEKTGGSLNNEASDSQ